MFWFGDGIVLCFYDFRLFKKVLYFGRVGLFVIVGVFIEVFYNVINIVFEG